MARLSTRQERSRWYRSSRSRRTTGTTGTTGTSGPRNALSLANSFGKRRWPAPVRSTDLTYQSYLSYLNYTAPVSSIPPPVDGYLARNGVADPHVVPLDRRRVRSAVLPDPAAARRVVRARGERGAVRVRVAARSSTCTACLPRCRCRCRRSSAMPTTSACSRSRISETSRCRRIWAPARPRRTRRSTARPLASSTRSSGAARSSRAPRSSRTASRSTWRS